MKTTSITTDTLRWLFLKNKESRITEVDAIKTDLTETYNQWKKEKIQARELIVIQVNGEVRTSKSTVGIHEVWTINKLLHEAGLNKGAEKNMWKWIFSDQTEFLRFINGQERNVALVIDEFNSLSKTGLNSTTEERLLDHYSDIFAGQYLHRVCMGTDMLTDKNTTVILEPMGKDEKKKITRCKLIYRDITTKQYLTIGHVNINVAPLLKNWIGKEIREIIETRGIQTDKEKRLIDEYKKKDFYVRYQVRKYDRMDLLKKEGVRDIRELEFADVILQVALELQDYSKTQKVDRELTDIIVDEVLRKTKRVYSILAKAEISKTVSAMLNINTKINQLYKKHGNTGKSKPTEAEKLVIEKSIRQLQDILKERIKNQEHLRDLYKKYLQIK